MEKEVLVIGGGPGGYSAAIRAAQLGAKVCLVEVDKLGGTCLNRGCIPTKALYRNAELINNLKSADEFGILVSDFKIDIEKIQERKQNVIDQLHSGIEQLMKANNIEVLKGKASFKDSKTVTAALKDGSSVDITSERIIIATGSTPAIPPIKGADIPGIYTSEEILNFEEIPETLAVIGGGVVGMELACIFNALGTKVTVIEYMPNILGPIDSDISKRMLVSLKKRGIDINTSVKVTSIEKVEDKFVVYGEGKKGELRIETDKLLMSAGRRPVVNGLNLEEAGIDYSPKGIKVDMNYETNVKGIYAVGDANGKIMLAHAAAHQGIKAAERVMGKTSEAIAEVVPSCIFVFPEIASAGITEDEAKAQGIDYKTSKFMFGANGKALALGEGEGFVKVIASEDNIIGVHIMGPHASDLIQEGTLAITSRLKPEQIINTIHAHPTLSEAFSEAVAGLNGEAIHIAPTKVKLNR